MPLSFQGYCPTYKKNYDFKLKINVVHQKEKQKERKKCASIPFSIIGRSLYRNFCAPRAAEECLLKGYLPPMHKLKAPYDYLIF